MKHFLGAFLIVGFLSCSLERNVGSPFTRRSHKRENIRVSSGFSLFSRRDDWGTDFGKKKRVRAIRTTRKFSATKGRFQQSIKGNKNKKMDKVKSTGGRKK